MTTTTQQVAEATAAAPSIRLHRNAPWVDRWVSGLVRTYRESFAQHGGRYYRVSRQNTRAMWEVEEIRADGTWLAWVTVSASNLPAARLAIALHAAGVDEDTLLDTVLRAPAAPTGRNARRNLRTR